MKKLVILTVLALTAVGALGVGVNGGNQGLVLSHG
jgi:hypothetical protein